MSDTICRKSMTRCLTSGMCSPHGGCQPEDSHMRAIRSLRGDCADLIAERDQLRAEVAGLRTGYEAYERVNAELKAECERLRKMPTCWSEVLDQAEDNEELLDKVLELSADAERYRFLCDKFGETKLPCAIERILAGDLYIADGKPSIDSAIDAAMGKGEQS